MQVMSRGNKLWRPFESNNCWVKVDNHFCALDVLLDIILRSQVKHECVFHSYDIPLIVQVLFPQGCLNEVEIC